MEKIDSLDRQILEIISQNARIPFKDVAAECGVSRAAIHQRVQRLIDLGVIIGSGYHVNPKSLGYRTCTYVGIKLEKGSMYKNVVAELKKIPEIVDTFLIIGLFHPIVVKAEYYWGTRCWWIFLVLGIAGIIGTVLISDILISSLLGVFSFSSFWTIKEIFEQRERVLKGWFPMNPKRKHEYE